MIVGVVVGFVQEAFIFPDDAGPVQEVVGVAGCTLGKFQNLVVRLHNFHAVTMTCIPCEMGCAGTRILDVASC